MLRKQDGERISEYPVDPAHVAAALAAKTCFDTGILSANTLLVRQDGVKHTVVEYRPPQKTGIYLDSSETALRVPLPPLVLLRVTAEGGVPQYGVFAVKQRPADLTVPLFNAPLPNVFTSGSICWGSVKRVSESSLARTSLAEDWQMLLGSPFGDHYVESSLSSSHGRSAAIIVLSVMPRSSWRSRISWSFLRQSCERNEVGH